MKRSILTASVALAASACGLRGTTDTINNVPQQTYRSEVNFNRLGLSIGYDFKDTNGNIVLRLDCHSFSDDEREGFAIITGTDAVSDLSCYLKDKRYINEYTMLSPDNESLQYTPGFFWFENIEKCQDSYYYLSARLRGIEIQFTFSDIDAQKKSSVMEVNLKPFSNAKNFYLESENFQSGCG